MNNLGYSNDNLHVGDTFIKNGDLEVDGALIVDSVNVNSLTIGDPEYTLPTSAGTVNQVITMNPDNTTTSFQDINIPDLVNERVCVSRWFTQQQSLLDFSAYIGIFLNSNTGDSTTTGANVIPASDFTLSEENYTVLHVQFILRINTTDIAQPNQWQCKMRLNDGVGVGEIEWEVEEFSGTIQTNSERIQDFYLTFIRNPTDPTKINISNQCFKHTNAISGTVPTSTNLDKLFLSNNQFKLGSQTGEISMPLPTTKSYFCQFNNYANGRPRPNPNAFNIIQYGVLVGELYTFKKQTLPTGGTPLNDHLLLSNLNGGTGDGGHINLYDRRGVKPMTGDVNINGNSLLNVQEINGQGGLAYMRIDNTAGLLQIDGGEITQTADTNINLYPNNILRLGNSGQDIRINPATEVDLQGGLNMNNNNINNVNQVSSSGVLNLQGALGARVDIGVGGSGRMEIEDTRVFISQFADLNIHDKIVYVQPNTMPSVYDDGKTYIFVGSRTTSTPIILNGISVTFKGSSRETSSIEYTGVGSFITTTDCDFSLIDLTLKCDVSGSLLLTASNPSKLNVLSIFNCEVRESYEFANISGHELVDINNTLFIHLRGDGVLTNQKCLYINGVAKTNITSCEIVKFFEIGQPANTNPFDGAMIYVTGACGAVSVIGGIIHPRVNQRAVEIDNTATFLEFALNTNNFIDIGLTTGTILQTNS
ncbi:MAG: hypothetical protein ACYTBJ_27110, partial [Planctomycetota bacterium]